MKETLTVLLKSITTGIPCVRRTSGSQVTKNKQKNNQLAPHDVACYGRFIDSCSIGLSS